MCWECVCMLCVCYFELCVDSHTDTWCTHTYLLENDGTINFHDTSFWHISYSLLLYHSDALARVTTYCPFKIHIEWLLCVDSTFKYKSSEGFVVRYTNGQRTKIKFEAYRTAKGKPMDEALMKTLHKWFTEQANWNEKVTAYSNPVTIEFLRIQWDGLHTKYESFFSPIREQYNTEFAHLIDKSMFGKAVSVCDSQYKDVLHFIRKEKPVELHRYICHKYIPKICHVPFDVTRLLIQGDSGGNWTPNQRAAVVADEEWILAVCGTWLRCCVWDRVVGHKSDQQQLVWEGHVFGIWTWGVVMCMCDTAVVLYEPTITTHFDTLLLCVWKIQCVYSCDHWLSDHDVVVLCGCV